MTRNRVLTKTTNIMVDSKSAWREIVRDRVSAPCCTTLNRAVRWIAISTTECVRLQIVSLSPNLYFYTSCFFVKCDSKSHLLPMERWILSKDGVGIVWMPYKFLGSWHDHVNRKETRLQIVQEFHGLRVAVPTAFLYDKKSFSGIHLWPQRWIQLWREIMVDTKSAWHKILRFNPWLQIVHDSKLCMMPNRASFSELRTGNIM